jgi:hypothetical protein
MIDDASAGLQTRERIVSEAAHSSAMAGLVSTWAFQVDAAAFVEGAIDADELVRRTRARYTLR